MKQIMVTSNLGREILNITSDVESYVPEGDGVMHVFVAHSTAAITTADLDPGTDDDLLHALDNMLPDLQWKHLHDPAHAPDHLVSSIVGPSITVPFADGKLLLGVWQQIVLIEMDGPRERKVIISCSE